MQQRKVPKLTTDAEAEAFLDQDLFDLDFGQFKPLTWETEAKSARVNTAPPTPCWPRSRPAPPNAASPTTA